MAARKIKPLPCPFCGKDPEIANFGKGCGAQVQCEWQLCHVQPFCEGSGRITAIRQWNVRHTRTWNDRAKRDD